MNMTGMHCASRFFMPDTAGSRVEAALSGKLRRERPEKKAGKKVFAHTIG